MDTVDLDRYANDPVMKRIHEQVMEHWRAENVRINSLRDAIKRDYERLKQLKAEAKAANGKVRWLVSNIRQSEKRTRQRQPRKLEARRKKRIQVLKNREVKQAAREAYRAKIAEFRQQMGIAPGGIKA